MNDPRCYHDGRKLGYMELMKNLWEENGYNHLGLSARRLRDKAANVEKQRGLDLSQHQQNVGAIWAEEDSEERSLNEINNYGRFIPQQHSPNLH